MLRILHRRCSVSQNNKRQRHNPDVLPAGDARQSCRTTVMIGEEQALRLTFGALVIFTTTLAISNGRNVPAHRQRVHCRFCCEDACFLGQRPILSRSGQPVGDQPPMPWFFTIHRHRQCGCVRLTAQPPRISITSSCACLNNNIPDSMMHTRNRSGSITSLDSIHHKRAVTRVNIQQFTLHTYGFDWYNAPDGMR